MKKYNKSGFTLVEVLIAVGVLAVGSLAFLPSFTGANKQKALAQAVENAKDAIATARNRALTETYNPGEGNPLKYAGVRFTYDNGTYELFRSDVASAAVCQNKASTNYVPDSTKTLPGDVRAKITQPESPTCMFFEFGTGNAYTTKGSTPCASCND